MSWSRTNGIAAGRWRAYPIVLLLASALTAGCGAAERPAAGPPVRGVPTTTPAPTPTGAQAASGAPTAQDRPAPPPTPRTGARYVFPVLGKASYHPTHAGYPATDIFAPCGAPVVAVTDGKILEVSRTDSFDKSGPLGPLNGGKFVSLLGDDGLRYYGSHLTDVAAGIDAGVRVRAGQRVGTVGRTGNANNVCHLHFGISPPCRMVGDWWIRRGVVWPATFLDAWRRGISKTAADQVAAWQRQRGCPKAP